MNAADIRSLEGSTLAVVPAIVKKWLQDEGLFLADRPHESAIGQWDIRVSVNPQQSINMVVGINKARPDAVVTGFSIIPAPRYQQAFSAFDDEGKQYFVRRLVGSFIKDLDLVPSVELPPGGQLQIRLQSVLYEDGLSKNALIDRIQKLLKAFLYFEVESDHLFQPQQPGPEYLKP